LFLARSAPPGNALGPPQLASAGLVVLNAVAWIVLLAYLDARFGRCERRLV
jgi:hypothetical protein